MINIKVQGESFRLYAVFRQNKKPRLGVFFDDDWALSGFLGQIVLSALADGQNLYAHQVPVFVVVGDDAGLNFSGYHGFLVRYLKIGAVCDRVELKFHGSLLLQAGHKKFSYALPEEAPVTQGLGAALCQETLRKWLNVKEPCF